MSAIDLTLGGVWVLFFIVWGDTKSGLDAECSFIVITIIVLLVDRILSIHSILMVASGAAFYFV